MLVLEEWKDYIFVVEMKLVLKKLDIPFYDPMFIVKKTKVRMANDYS